MSSRALRKAQREREEQDRLNRQQHALHTAEEEEEEEEEHVTSIQPKKSAFAMLQEQEEGDDESDQDDHVAENVDSQKPEPQQTSSAKKRKKKKKRARNKTAPQQQAEELEDGLDEIDIALKQLSTRNDAVRSGATESGIDFELEKVNKLLAVDTSHLHAQNEMRRLFGRAAFEDHDDEQQPDPGTVGGNRRQQRRMQQVGLAQALRGQRQAGRMGAFSAIALRRNIFVQGKEEWPSATTGGLSMEVEEKRPDGTVLYRYVRSSVYQDVQAQFESCVESMDPNRLVILLQHNPYHISTLLQVSEIAKAERDHATSGDLLERALFSFGRAVHSTFAKNLSEGKARLDFRRSENRELWLASWRYMQNLSMRATWRTVYEWAKLLLSLSPDDDPYAIWSVLDQYALRSRQDLDYLNMSKNPLLMEAHRNAPNVQLSQGLAEVRAGNSGRGKQALFTAVGKYPWIVARLLQELNLDAPPAVWGKEPRTETERLYCELYVATAKDLWNTPETSDLLLEIASAIPPATKSAPIDDTEVTQNVARQVLLSDNPALIALVPRKYTAQLRNASDPIPPDDAFMSSLQRQHGDPGREVSLEESLSELQGLQHFFTQMFPWYGRMQNGSAGESGESDNDGNGEERQPNISQEEIERQIQESGVSQADIARQAHRMAQIEDSLFDQFGELDPEQVQRLISDNHMRSAGETGSVAGNGLENTRHARVEDVEEEDEDE